MSELPVSFGPFELERRLGAGGMAETFVAVRHGPGGFRQRVCVKRILPALEQDPGFVELFLEEARVSARLHHSNIAQVLDFGVVEGQHYLALELIDGIDLRGLLTATRHALDPLTTGVVAHIALELGAALDFAHAADTDGRARGIVHRDISPSNVLLSRAGEVKLTDFGIAKAMSSDAATRTAIIKGKIPYMAPEYARGGHFRPRSDLFSLGVTLYECLAGRRPFDGATEVETLERLSRGEHPPLRELAPLANPSFVAAVEALIHNDPEARTQTAGAFLDALAATAPPPTAELILSDVVRRYAPAREPVAAQQPTRALTKTPSADKDPAARVAPADAPTATRLPSANEVPTKR